MIIKENNNFRGILYALTVTLLFLGIYNLRILMIGQSTFWTVFELLLNIGLMIPVAFVWHMHQQRR